MACEQMPDHAISDLLERLSGNDEELLSEQSPCQRQLEVGPYQEWMSGERPLRREWQEACDANLYLETLQLQGFGQRQVRQPEVMIVEIPVLSGQVAQIGTENQIFSTRFQGNHDLVQEQVQGMLVGEVLQEVRGEYRIRASLDYRAQFRGPALMEFDIGPQVLSCVCIQVDGNLPAGADVVQELPISAGYVDHSVRWLDETPQEAAA